MASVSPLKIAVTGSGGTVGRILMPALDTHDVSGLDLPEHDILDLDMLVDRFRGVEVVVHLAWSAGTENAFDQSFDPSNLQMSYNVLRAAQLASVRRVILASSVHVDIWGAQGKPAVFNHQFAGSGETPTSPYGASKLMIEALGRHFAERYQVQVACLRLGGVWSEHRTIESIENAAMRKVFLNHTDLVRVFRFCIENEMREDYCCFYAVSDNPERVHDLSNPFGWGPVGAM